MVKKVEIVECPIPPTHIDNEGENTELLRLSWGDDRGSKIKLIKFVRTQFQVSRLIISITLLKKTKLPGMKILTFAATSSRLTLKRC